MDRIDDPSCVAVIGLGKLGAPLAACLASKGFQVVGVDVSESAVGAINAGRSPVFEPGLDELIDGAQQNLSATLDYQEAVAASQATFILVPTPSDDDGSFSNRFVLEAAAAIGRVLRDKDEYHVVVVTSTVMPGTTEREVIPALEEASGKRCGEAFGVCYNPEFIALGSVIRDMLNPDAVLIGESDRKAGDLLESIYERLCDNDPPVSRMNLVNAELTKLSVNTFVTTKITFANFIARLCEQLPGANVDVVSSALGLDSRIGRKYLTGAIGYGGPCFPRDNMALSWLAEDVGVPATLARATDASNEEQIPQLIALIRSKLRDGGTVGILGLSYKPDTDVVERSQGLELAVELAQQGMNVVAWDPAATSNAARALGDAPVHLSWSVEECIQDSDVLVLTTPWDEFLSIPAQLLEREGNKRVVIDCWRALDSEKYENVTDYVPLGVGMSR